MQTFYIGNSLLGDRLAIAQQLISDILTCFRGRCMDRAPLAAEAPYPIMKTNNENYLQATALLYRYFR